MFQQILKAVWENKLILNLAPQCIFLLQEEGEKEALEHFKEVIKSCANRWHIFQNTLQVTWTAVVKILTILLLDVHMLSM